MTKEEFHTAIFYNQFDKVEPLFASGEDLKAKYGFDIDDSAMRASWGKDDFEKLYFFWKYGAKPLTPAVAETFEKFSKGVTAEELTKEQDDKENAKIAATKADLTDFKSVKQIPIDEVDFELKEENIGELRVHYASFLYDGDVYDSDVLFYGNLQFDNPPVLNKKYDFSKKNFGESFCFMDEHNPVDLLTIEFKQFSDTEMKLEIQLLFNLEDEDVGKNEILTLEATVKR